jgi:hypothetical protein
VSVYFEANGHGTILFSPSAVSALLAAARSPPPRCDAARRLLCVRSLVNQAVGDALSDLLLVRALLARRWWGGAEWDALYTDLPSRQTKLLVADRGAVHTSQDEATATAPPGLQQGLDALATAAQHGRCFVRPSGTEDVVSSCDWHGQRNGPENTMWREPRLLLGGNHFFLRVWSGNTGGNAAAASWLSRMSRVPLPTRACFVRTKYRPLSHIPARPSSRTHDPRYVPHLPPARCASTLRRPRRLPPTTSLCRRHN